MGILDAQREELEAAMAANSSPIFFVQTQKELADVLATIIRELTCVGVSGSANILPTATPVQTPVHTLAPATTPGAGVAGGEPTPGAGVAGSEPTPTPASLAPVITLSGSSPESVEAGIAYADAGATASDDLDGDITASVITVNTVDTSVPGSYVVTYDVTDSSGNPALQVTRTVNVVDTTPPVINLLGLNPATAEAGAAYSDAGATASDIVDGSITANIVAVNSANMGVTGSYTVTYDVTDSSGNPALQVTRTVNVVDTTPPAIVLVGLSLESVEAGTNYLEAGADAFDIGDGNLTTKIVIVDSVNTAVPGSYTVTYEVTDSSGNTAIQVVRKVSVVDTTPPVIILLGSDPDPVRVAFNGVYIDAGASASDIVDGDITASIVTNNPVVTKVIGAYTVTYDVIDSSGNEALQVTRTVMVVAR